MTMFEAFFTMVASNSLNVALSRYSHPEPHQHWFSLRAQPAIVGSNKPGEEDLSPEVGRMTVVSVGFSIIWCGGFLGLLFSLFSYIRERGMAGSKELSKLVLPYFARFED